MPEDRKKVRRFLRREPHERTTYTRSYGQFLSLLAYRVVEAWLAAPEVEVVEVTNYADEDAYPMEEIPKVWANVPVAFEEREPFLVEAVALTRMHEMEDLPVVFTLSVKERSDETVLDVILRREDRSRLAELLRWLDALEERVHPYAGKLLQVTPDGLSFLPPQGVRREDVFLPDHVLEELERGFVFLSDPESLPPALRHRAVLLAGPPGVGKTLACKWLAGVVDATVLWTSPRALWKAGPEKILDLARRLRPALVILEDLDVAAGGREGSTPLGDLLAQLDGFGSLEDIGLVATTNHPEVLDHALDPRTRPGRFQRFLELGAMEEELRRRLLARLLAEDKVLPGDDRDALERLCGVTRGFTGAQVAGLVRDLELMWMWERDRGNRPTLDSVIEKAINGRPSITRAMGFSVEGREDVPAAVASAARTEAGGGV